MTMGSRLRRLTLLLWSLNVVALAGANVGKAGVNNAPIHIKETSVTYFPQRCLPEAATGHCRASMRKFYFNIKSGQCEPFIYGGCGGNWNRFDTLSECHKTCTCKTPRETGPCRGHFRRWFYSPADGCCRPFIYGGCGGNSNNHATWTECSDLCGYPTTDSKWWEWGADWWKWNAHLNETSGSGSMQANASRTYSRDDFMRDWILWGLLTGGEGEIEMETLATLIAQAHMLGFGKATGSAGAIGASRGSGSNAALNNVHSIADTRAALGYFQQYFGEEAESRRGGIFGSGGQTYGPAYNFPRPGSFTPLGGVGSIDNMVSLGAGMFGTNGWDSNGGGAAGYLNHLGAGQFGHGTQAGHAQASSGSKRIKASAGEANWHESRGRSRSQNLGNTRQGWAPHGENVLPSGSGSGQFGTFSTGAGAAIEMLRMIGQLSTGNLKPADMMGLAKRFGAIHANGNVNLDVLAQRMVNSLRGPSGTAQFAQLKGIAEALGGLDANGNINVKLLMREIAKSLGRGGLGKGRFGVSQGASASGAATIGGGSRKKTYGKK